VIGYFVIIDRFGVNIRLNVFELTNQGSDDAISIGLPQYLTKSQNISRLCHATKVSYAQNLSARLI